MLKDSVGQEFREGTVGKVLCSTTSGGLTSRGLLGSQVWCPSQEGCACPAGTVTWSAFHGATHSSLRIVRLYTVARGSKCKCFHQQGGSCMTCNDLTLEGLGIASPFSVGTPWSRSAPGFKGGDIDPTS